MSAWDAEIFSEEPVIDFLDELLDLDDEDILEAVSDAIVLGRDSTSTDDERTIALAAATVAAIWAGAPYTAGETVEDYPFIRQLAGRADESLYEPAAALLEQADTDQDVDPFIEALS